MSVPVGQRPVEALIVVEPLPILLLPRYQRHDAPPGMILIVDAEARAVSRQVLREPLASRAELNERGLKVACPPHPVGDRQVPRVDQQLLGVAVEESHPDRIARRLFP